MRRMKPSSGAASGSVLVRIRAALPDLAPAERRVAEAALHDPSETAASTIGELARRCSTSETTVLRFCRAVGYGGYPDLRLALATEIGRADGAGAPYVSGEILPDDTVAEVIGKISATDSEAITATAAQLDHAVVRKVVRALQRAGRIDVYGVGASAHVAQDFQQKLFRIGRVAFAWPDPHAARASAALLGKGDVAFAMSHTGTTADTVDCLRIAAATGATTVALTNYPRSPITEHAKLVLTTAARETTFRSGAMASRIAQLSVIDTLFVLVAQQDPTKTTHALERTFSAVRGGA